MRLSICCFSRILHEQSSVDTLNALEAHQDSVALEKAPFSLMLILGSISTFAAQLTFVGINCVSLVQIL